MKSCKINTECALCDSSCDNYVELVELKHGCWEIFGNKRRCSICGTGYADVQLPYSFNYCPHCGASMDKVNNDSF